MKIDLIKDKFEECKGTNSFKRVDSNHPVDLYVGYNEKNQKTFVVIANSSEEYVESSKLIEVKLSKRADGKLSLSFNLLDDKMSDIFYSFCSDIIQKTYNLNDYSPISFVIDRWKNWMKMFKNPNSLLLPENEVRGLLGELIFLKEYMFPKYGIEKSLESWIGSSLAHKDFEVDDTWYEIKTIKENAITVEISSIEQLDSNVVGKLVIVKLEPSNKAISNPIMLNQYVKDIENMLESKEQIEKLYNKLDQRNYYYSEDYDKYVYCNKGINKYTVNDQFPRIKSEDLKEGIVRVSYQLYLNNIKEYLEEGE